MARLTIRVRSGRFQVTLDSHPIASFESDKVRALLAYLAVEARRPHPREALAEPALAGRPERRRQQPEPGPLRPPRVHR